MVKMDRNESLASIGGGTIWDRVTGGIVQGLLQGIFTGGQPRVPSPKSCFVIGFKLLNLRHSPDPIFFLS